MPTVEKSEWKFVNSDERCPQYLLLHVSSLNLSLKFQMFPLNCGLEAGSAFHLARPSSLAAQAKMNSRGFTYLQEQCMALNIAKGQALF
jgi:hypothetical protein